ncbi:nuclear distribution protein nudE-like 1-A isoform X2 [Dendroctonus ponderosae]|uniref:NUDE domain-containing protein n=2 Tax=Dendroctonus ponderosae TaxID=77166 RepID=A0AAR5P0X0_DENPD|nr:nuclear distribution protein nudE-like 1-A isoform X2 [Dendroctonus ponderosae]
MKLSTSCNNLWLNYVQIRLSTCRIVKTSKITTIKQSKKTTCSGPHLTYSKMSTSIEPPKFASPDEEIKFWKALALKYHEDLEKAGQEADEFMMDSKQLEKELESTIDQNERKIKELSISNNRAQNEVDAIRVKLDICFKERTNQQTEIDQLKAEKQDLISKIIELENCNDDLERSRRIIEESMAGFEQALNSALEKNAMLENEVDEKERLREKLQRLADEVRDLKQELLVKEKERAPDNERYMNGFKSPSIDNRLKENETQTSTNKREYPPQLTPASRVMALNIVSDLIRKVGLSRYLCSQCGQVKCTMCGTDSSLLNSSS